MTIKKKLSLTAQPQTATPEAPKIPTQANNQINITFTTDQPAQQQPQVQKINFDELKKNTQTDQKNKTKEQKKEDEKQKLEEKRDKIRKEMEAKKVASGQTKEPEFSEKKMKHIVKQVQESKEQRDLRITQWDQVEKKQREATKPQSTDSKPLCLIIAGHVDHGKSTLSGHFLVNMGKIDERQLQKYQQEAAKMQQQAQEYAFAMDACQEERERGITIESARATFQTPSGRRVVLLDSPGHKGFISSMIESSAQADVAVLVISARKGEFETGFAKGGQTCEHALILFISGIKQLIVAVNKMDDPTCNYDKSRFEQIQQQMMHFLTTSVGFDAKKIWFIPISGKTGENLTKPLEPNSPLQWYQGKTLLELVDSCEVPQRDVGGFFRACISGKYHDNGFYIVAKIEKGQVRKGDKCIIMPHREECVVLSMEDEAGAKIEYAQAGENCRLEIEQEVFDNVTDGSVICEFAHPCETAKSFIAKILCVDCPSIMSEGFAAIVHVNTQTSPFTVKSIVGVLNSDGKIDPNAPPYVKPGQNALVEIELRNEICVNKFKAEGFLGRVLMRHESTTIAVGQVVKMVYE